MPQSSHLEVAKVLLSELHFFLAALNLLPAEVAGQGLKSLQRALVGRHVKIQLVVLAPCLDILSDDLASSFGLADPSLCLHVLEPS